ncbi:hypothetical protein DUI37_28360, partial [Bacillus anthracis]
FYSIVRRPPGFGPLSSQKLGQSSDQEFFHLKNDGFCLYRNKLFSLPLNIPFFFFFFSAFFFFFFSFFFFLLFFFFIFVFFFICCFFFFFFCL